MLGHIRPLFLPKNRGPERVSVMAVFKGILQVVFYIYVSIYMICKNRYKEFLFSIILEWMFYFGVPLSFYSTPHQSIIWGRVLFRKSSTITWLFSRKAPTWIYSWILDAILVRALWDSWHFFIAHLYSYCTRSNDCSKTFMDLVFIQFFVFSFSSV